MTMVKPKTKGPDQKVRKAVDKTLDAHPATKSTPRKQKQSNDKGKPFTAQAKTLPTLAGKAWSRLVAAMGRDRGLTEREIAWAFEETSRRHAGMKPTEDQLVGTFNEVVASATDERCTTRDLHLRSTLSTQLVDILAGRKTYFSNRDMPPGALDALKDADGIGLSLADLPLTAAERAAAEKRLAQLQKSRNQFATNKALSVEAERLADLLIDRVEHVRDAEIDGLEFFDFGSLLPLKDGRKILLGSEEYKTVKSGGAGKQSALRLNRIFRPDVSDKTVLKLTRTSSEPLMERARRRPELAEEINTTVGMLLLPASSQGADQTIVKATSSRPDSWDIATVRAGKGLVEKKRSMGEVIRRSNKVQLTVFKEKVRMPGREIREVFRTLRRQ